MLDYVDNGVAELCSKNGSVSDCGAVKREGVKRRRKAKTSRGNERQKNVMDAVKE
jgi:hypothetical protein